MVCSAPGPADQDDVVRVARGTRSDGVATSASLTPLLAKEAGEVAMALLKRAALERLVQAVERTRLRLGLQEL